MSRFAKKGEIGNFVRSVKKSKIRGWNDPNEICDFCPISEICENCKQWL